MESLDSSNINSLHAERALAAVFSKLKVLINITARQWHNGTENPVTKIKTLSLCCLFVNENLLINTKMSGAVFSLNLHRKLRGHVPLHSTNAKVVASVAQLMWHSGGYVPAVRSWSMSDKCANFVRFMWTVKQRRQKNGRTFGWSSRAFYWGKGEENNEWIFMVVLENKVHYRNTGFF